MDNFTFYRGNFICGVPGMELIISIHSFSVA